MFSLDLLKMFLLSAHPPQLVLNLQLLRVEVECERVARVCNMFSPERLTALFSLDIPKIYKNCENID